MRHRSTVLAALILAGGLFGQVDAGAGQAVDVIDLLSTRTVSAAQVSPNGQHVAYVVRGLRADGSLDSFRSNVRVASIRDRTDWIVSSGDHSARSPRWSPDGQELAYISSRSGADQIWVARGREGDYEAVRVTDVPTGVRSFAWDPSGERMAFVSFDPENPDLTSRRELVRLASDVPAPARLWVLSLDSPDDATALTGPSMHVTGTPDWSPDGSLIAFNHQPDASENAVFEASTSVVEVQTGAVRLLRFTGVYAYQTSPVFSPDGRWVAFMAVTTRQPGSPSGAVYAVSVDGSEERSLDAAGIGTEVAGWTADGTSVVVVRPTGSLRQIARLPLDGRSVNVVYRGPLVVSELHVEAQGGLAVFVAESLDTPPEVYVYRLDESEPSRVTSVNSEVSLPPFGRTTLVSWESTDGVVVEGLLTYPVGFTNSSPAPLLVVAHAGGETFTSSFVGNPAAGSSWAYPPPVFSSRGFAVLRVNQRGGGLSGYGHDSSLPTFKPELKANADILTGVDHLIEMGVADPDRLGIMGWSNGGLVTASLLTTTDRFVAASVVAGFPYLSIMSATNPIMTHDLGAEPWEDLQPYLEHSPSLALDRVRAPTLIIHGETDTQVPVSQARALHGALSKLGVPVELAVYQGMGHGPSKPSQYIDVAERNLSWFERYLRGR